MYGLYGLRIQSSVPIYGLSRVAEFGPADLRVMVGERPAWTLDLDLARERVLYSTECADEDSEPNLRVWAIHDYQMFLLRYAGGIEFLIDATGTSVWTWWPSSQSFSTACMYLVGPVLGFVLQLRGYTSLHASCAAAEGGVIGFVGDCGAGKSTIAAALAERGYQVLSDDVLALRSHNGGFLVQPGPSRIRLWPSSVKMLFGSDDALPRLSTAFDKRYLEISREATQSDPAQIRLKTLYLLRQRSDSDSAPFLGEIKPADALIGLVGNTYTSYLQDASRRARDFAFLGQVTASVRLRTLTPHTDPARLEDLCNLVLEDCRKAKRTPAIA
ncbi:MAG TPA: hypothetical protein VEB03_01040 [Candidatus Nanoarchaeia archaeon]|nr:hypothetical protein [Candidatus Nanoarchaeia archaeon]